MKINELKINSFGKIKNKEIKFDNGVNVLYGKNEAGKSTLLNFMFNSFYGVSKNKKGKNISDYEQYKPWEGEEFSGKIAYELDNEKKYEIYRDFNKKNPKIFNENYEDISKEFNIDKKTGNEFFYEQTKIDEDLFLSTIGILQKNVELEKNNQNFLVQKLANLVGTGEDNVSYKRAVDRISKRQLDEVGTDRSREKPINIVTRNIEQLKLEIESLENYQDKKYEIAEEENDLVAKIEELKNKEKTLKEIKILLENQKIEQEKINIKENLKIENEQKIEELINNQREAEEIQKRQQEQINIQNKNNQKQKEKFKQKMSILFCILIVINLAIILLLDNNIKYTTLVSIPIYIFIWNRLKNKLNKKIKAITIDVTENLELNNIQNQIALLKITNENLEKEIIDLTNKLNLKTNLEIEKIKNKNYEFKNSVPNDLNRINIQIVDIQNQLNDGNIELHKLKLDKENIEPQLDKLAGIEEKLEINKSNKQELEELNLSMEIAKKALEEAYTQMKESITPKFTQNLSKIIATITDNKYKSIRFNEENGIMVELPNGDYVTIDKLSTGTIEQLYLSLRISMIDELSEERMPLFLDETFAYYDDERLKNILLFLLEEAKKRQIFILTCSKREIKVLNDINAKFNLVEL